MAVRFAREPRRQPVAEGETVLLEYEVVFQRSIAPIQVRVHNQKLLKELDRYLNFVVGRSPMPKFIGQIRVNKLRWLKPNIQYAMLLSRETLVFAKIGGQYADMTGGAAGRFLLGPWLATKIGDKALKQDERAQETLNIPVEELLKVDKVNFQVHTSEVERIEVGGSTYQWKTKSFRTGTLKFTGRTESGFDIAPKQDLENCVALLTESLPGKVMRK